MIIRWNYYSSRKAKNCFGAFAPALWRGVVVDVNTHDTNLTAYFRRNETLEARFTRNNSLAGAFTRNENLTAQFSGVNG
jgi:hypothetical protein